MKRLFAIISTVAVLAACDKTEITQQTTAPAIIHATLEDVDATKTYMGEDRSVRWSEGDQVLGFMGSANGLKYQLISSYAGETNADFQQLTSGGISSGSALDHNVVLYPYSDATSISKTEDGYTLNIELPAQQNYVADSFGNGSMAMISVSETNSFSFDNILGALKLQLKGNQRVASLKIIGNKFEKLSGVATVTAYSDDRKPLIVMSSDSYSEVTLDCSSGVRLNESTPTTFIIPLPPVVFSEGFTVIITDKIEQVYVISTDKKNEVKRSTLLAMPALSITGNKVQSGDYVDEYGINHGKGTDIGGVTWAPVNCGYHKTAYKYGKLYQWGRKYGFGYDESDATVPTIETGGDIPAELGNEISKSNVFFTGESATPNDWANPHNGMLWNVGTESSPVKSQYDPCPKYWRIPTITELKKLPNSNNDTSLWATNEEGINGYWFIDKNSGERLFFPAAGSLDQATGNATNRGKFGYYWSSEPNNINYGSGRFISHLGSSNYATVYRRASAFSIRCVRE